MLDFKFKFNFFEIVNTKNYQIISLLDKNMNERLYELHILLTNIKHI